MVPTITQTKNVKGTPFITNVEKEVYSNKKSEENIQDNLNPNTEMETHAQETAQTLTQIQQQGETQPKMDERQPSFYKDKGKKKVKSRDGIPITQTQPILKTGPGQPTFKLEMFAPPQEPVRPVGIYDRYMPLVKIPGVPDKFSPSLFPYIYAPSSVTSWGPAVKMPMQQVYNITLPGPTGAHVQMSKIYENVLPGKDNKFTSTTIGERVQMYDYVRQIFVKINDGEDMSLDSDGQNSLMSYIKFMELNPNYYSPINVNPYKGLPFGLLIYRSCFPIRVDQASDTVTCAKNSFGLNIRLYALSYAEYYSYKFRQIIYKEYDVWRELAYYEYVRENIIKKRQSPNFPILYAFFLSPNKTIDFFSLKKACLTQKDMLTKQYQKFVEIHTLFSSVQKSSDIIRPITLPDAAKKVIAKLPDEIDPALQTYSGTTLILITEAPHHNLYQWASRKYETEGIIKKMISHGYHDERVWFVIIFQIIAALYIMQIHGIYIRNMTIEDNVYIKDLQTYGKAAGYWKYVIDGISYYIPNYGYIVFIDSNFKDIIPQTTTVDRCKREYKIYTSNIFGKKYSITDIRNKVYENYRNIINTNAFTKEHTQNNVTRPPECIMKLLESMMNDPETNLGKILSKYFRPVMNNRIGTLLRKDTEIPNIRDTTKQFSRGEMAIEVLEEDLYRWCLISYIKDNGIIEIITRDHTKTDCTKNDQYNCGDFITKDIRIERLKQYAASQKFDQNMSNDVNLSEEELLETYMVSGTAFDRNFNDC